MKQSRREKEYWMTNNTPFHGVYRADDPSIMTNVRVWSILGDRALVTGIEPKGITSVVCIETISIRLLQ